MKGDRPPACHSLTHDHPPTHVPRLQIPVVLIKITLTLIIIIIATIFTTDCSSYSEVTPENYFQEFLTNLEGILKIKQSKAPSFTDLRIRNEASYTHCISGTMYKGQS